MIVYDVGDKRTFERAKQWLDTVRAEVTSDCVIGLVGNKSDRKDRVVPQSEGAEFARMEGILFFETSAKDNRGIDDMFMEFSKLLAQQILKKNKTEMDQRVTVDGSQGKTNNDGCGC